MLWEHRDDTQFKVGVQREQLSAAETEIRAEEEKTWCTQAAANTADHGREATESQLKRGCVCTYYPVKELGTLHWQPCKSPTLESSLQRQTT